MFVATASHELRTPLTSLQSAARADRRRDRRPGAHASRTSSEALAAGPAPRAGCSKGLLDLSPAGRGRALRSEPVELGELSRAVAAEFGRERPTLGRAARAPAGRSATPRASPGSCACWSTTRSATRPPRRRSRCAHERGQRPRRGARPRRRPRHPRRRARRDLRALPARREHDRARLRPRPGDRRRAGAADAAAS